MSLPFRHRYLLLRQHLLELAEANPEDDSLKALVSLCGTFDSDFWYLDPDDNFYLGSPLIFDSEEDSFVSCAGGEGGQQAPCSQGVGPSQTGSV